VFDALNILSSNLAELMQENKDVSMRVCDYIPYDFLLKDPYKSCPFYMSAFFLGLRVNDTTPAVIPVDTRSSSSILSSLMTNHKKNDIESKIFGAPVAALSETTSVALPVSVSALFGEEDARKLLADVTARNNETYPPRASDKLLCNLMNAWGPLKSLKNIQRVSKMFRLSNAKGYTCPIQASHIHEFHSRVAREFNALQQQQPSDGIKLYTERQFLSVVTHFDVPLPTSEKWKLSCIQNLRAALETVAEEMIKSKESAQPLVSENAVPLRNVMFV
jgi:hypothetical protein